MEPLKIAANGDTAKPGDFGAVVGDGVLILPREIAEALAGHGVRNATEFLSYLQAFPTAIADELHWAPADVANALARLRVQLRGRVADDFLDPPQRPARRYGALPPDQLNRRKTPAS